MRWKKVKKREQIKERKGKKKWGRSWQGESVTRGDYGVQQTRSLYIYIFWIFVLGYVMKCMQVSFKAHPKRMFWDGAPWNGGKKKYCAFVQYCIVFCLCSPSYITQLKPLPPLLTSSWWPTAPDALTTAMTPRQASFHSSTLARLRRTHTHTRSLWRSQTWSGSCGLVLRGSTDWTLCLSGRVKNKTRERVWLALYQC